MSGKLRLLGLMALLIALPCMLLAGCGSKETGGKADGGTGGSDDGLLGKWLDVNGDTVLEVKEKRLKLTSGSWSESYPYTLVTENRITELRGKGPGGEFGILSAIQVMSDGSLSAYEMIMDGDSHHYRFVREEEKAAMLEIQDLSRDLPKEIESREIAEFSLSFKNYGSSYGLEGWPSGLYFWELEPAEDGDWDLSLRAMGDSYIAMDASTRVDKAFMQGLDQRIRDLGIPEHNGYRQANEVDRPGWSLRVKYASGEKLELSAGGDAANTCVFDLAGLMEYVRPLAEHSSGY